MLKVANFPITIKSIKQPLIIAGDDIFLKQDCCNLFASYWQKQGFNLTRITLNMALDWFQLQELITHKSLFVENKVIICELNQKSISKKNDAILHEKLSSLPPNIKVVFLSNKITASTKKTSVFSTLTELTIWPLRNNELTIWTTNQAKFLGINCQPEQTQLLIKKSDLNPLTIKNNLKIMASNNCNELETEQINIASSQTDNWQILDYALNGNVKKLLAAISNIDPNSIMSLHNICSYGVKQLTKIYDLIHAGLSPETATAKILNWPKQRQSYLQAVLRHRDFDWHIIQRKMLKIDLELKGAKASAPCLHQLEYILLTIADSAFKKYIL